MNKKLVKAGVAGTAVLAIAVTGSTFSAWSDFGEEATGAAAGQLRLEIDGRDGSSSGVAPFSLAPGQNKYQTFYLASADAANVPTGVLTVTVQDLDDTEDDGPECTTESERVAEGGNRCGTEGELADQMKVQILATAPAAGQTSCPNTGYGVKTDPQDTAVLLADRVGTQYTLGELEAGDGICMRVEASLPESATNASQGDRASWDWRFDLTQK